MKNRISRHETDKAKGIHMLVVMLIFTVLLAGVLPPAFGEGQNGGSGGEGGAGEGSGEGSGGESGGDPGGGGNQTQEQNQEQNGGCNCSCPCNCSGDGTQNQEQNGEGNQNQEQNGGCNCSGNGTQNQEQNGEGNQNQEQNGGCNCSDNGTQNQEQNGEGNQNQEQNGGCNCSGNSTQNQEQNGEGNQNQEQNGGCNCSGNGAQNQEQNGEGNQKQEQNGGCNCSGNGAQNQEQNGEGNQNQEQNSGCNCSCGCNMYRYRWYGENGVCVSKHEGGGEGNGSQWRHRYENQIKEGAENGTLVMETTFQYRQHYMLQENNHYSPGMEIELMEVTKNRVRVRVQAEYSEGKVVALNIQENVLQFRNMENVRVRFDGKRIQSGSLEQVMAAKGEEARFVGAVEKGGSQFLVYIPHFSEHIIEIESLYQEELFTGMNYAVMGFGILILLGLSGYIFKIGKGRM